MNALLILFLTAPSMLSVSPLHNRYGWLDFAPILPSWLTGRLKKEKKRKKHFCILSVSPDITVVVNWVEKKREKKAALPSDWRSHRQGSHWSSGYHGLSDRFLARVAGARNHLDNNTAHASSVQRFKAPFRSGHATAAGRNARFKAWFSSGHATAAGRNARSPLCCGAKPDYRMKQRALRQCRAFQSQDPGGLACPHSGSVVHFTIKRSSRPCRLSCVVQPGQARKVLVVMFPSRRRLKGTKPRVLFKLVGEEN